MSKHTAPVIKLPQIRKHENADSLGIVDFGGYTVIVALKDWKEGDLCVYLEPDTVVDITRPEFNWLDRPRIKVKKLRGIYSQGLLIPAPNGLSLGDDAWEVLGLLRYEDLPSVGGSGSELERAPTELTIPKYDLENLRRYPYAITPDEQVSISEKIHGTSAGFAFFEGRMWARKRTGWVKEGDSWWWNILSYPANAWITDWCKRHEGKILLGEIYGAVQGGYPYDTNNETPLKFRAFDIFFSGKYHRLFDLTEDQMVPLLYEGPFSLQMALALAEGPSTIGGMDKPREGCVVSAGLVYEPRRMDPVKLKVVGNGYLEKAK